MLFPSSGPLSPPVPISSLHTNKRVPCVCWLLSAEFCKVCPLPTGWNIKCFCMGFKECMIGPRSFCSASLSGTLSGTSHAHPLPSMVFSLSNAPGMSPRFARHLFLLGIPSLILASWKPLLINRSSLESIVFSHFLRLLPPSQAYLLVHSSPVFYTWCALFLYKGERCLRDIVFCSVTQKSHLGKGQIR